jgi:hypothetical protein
MLRMAKAEIRYNYLNFLPIHTLSLAVVALSAFWFGPELDGMTTTVFNSTVWPLFVVYMFRWNEKVTSHLSILPVPNWKVSVARLAPMVLFIAINTVCIAILHNLMQIKISSVYGINEYYFLVFRSLTFFILIFIFRDVVIGIRNTFLMVISSIPFILMINLLIASSGFMDKFLSMDFKAIKAVMLSYGGLLPLLVTIMMFTISILPFNNRRNYLEE